MTSSAATSTRTSEGELSNAVLQPLRQRLLRHARHALASTSVAEDLVQDTLMVVVVAAAARRGESSLQTWAMGILKHKIADWYRSPARRVTVSLDADDEALERDVDALFDAAGRWAEPVVAWSRPDHDEERRQLVRTLDECLNHLPAQTGRVFVMREWLGFENPEIAERLGLSPDNIRQILHRARMGLRQCMQAHWTPMGKPA
ncbi:sigma-70 family RNA polymerase sigma factor [Rubrivivax albus]|uniref:sigma-70 family RNA polymerase sigma factor n=1 Tax=Rubrivivax albus TaxID=2499835 RepID=UPI0013051CC4|nr:sigma-70 family RNA polymerase sigma factor [Rubrivivax albus]